MVTHLCLGSQDKLCDSAMQMMCAGVPAVTSMHTQLLVQLLQLSVMRLEGLSSMVPEWYSWIITYPDVERKEDLLIPGSQQG